MLHPLLEIIQGLLQGGLTGAEILRTFFSRGVFSASSMRGDHADVSGAKLS
jgi:hypothetical protein